MGCLCLIFGFAVCGFSDFVFSGWDGCLVHGFRFGRVCWVLGRGCGFRFGCLVDGWSVGMGFGLRWLGFSLRIGCLWWF